MSIGSRVAIALLGALAAISVAAGEPEARRFGGVGFYHPRLMYLKYQPLVDYLGESTGEPWAARAVLVGEVDACGIRDTVGDRFVGRGLRTLAHSEPVPNYPLVGAPDLEPVMARAIRVALIDRPRAEAAVAARIASWDHELAGGLALAATGNFESVRRLAERIFGRDALWATPEELARRVGCRAP